MRHGFRALVGLIIALTGVIALGVGTVLTAAVALAASALIVPGTGTPDANMVIGYRQNARDYYLGTTPCTDATDCPDANLTGIDYPASFFPLAFIPGWCVPGRCNKWDDSVGMGVDNLDTKLRQGLAASTDPIAIFGYSQGAGVVSNELRNVGDLTATQKSQLSVVLIGDIDNPDGGLFTRLGFLGHIPFFDVTTGLATPVDTGIKLTVINFEYDGVGDFPKYGGNLLADLNAIAGFAYIHGTYLDPNQNGDFTGLPDGYEPADLLAQENCATHAANCRYDYYPVGSPNAGMIRNTYILIPSKTLPIVIPFLDLAAKTGTTAIVKPIVDLISPTLRVLIDLGYDRTVDPGVTAQLSPLPFNPATFKPVKLTFQLIAAAIQGIHDAIGDIAATPLIAPSTTRPQTSAAKRSTSAAVLDTGVVKGADGATGSAGDAKTGQSGQQGSAVTTTGDKSDDAKAAAKEAAAEKRAAAKEAAADKRAAAAEKRAAAREAAADKLAAAKSGTVTKIEPTKGVSTNDSSTGNDSATKDAA